MAETNIASITHEVFVPREIIYDLWTTAEHLQQWYPPSSSSNARASVDLRSGGTYQICWDDEDGNAVTRAGSYVDIAAPQRLVYTFAQDAEGDASGEVCVELEDVGGTTKISVQQSGLAGAAERERQAEYWRDALERLRDYLSVI